MGRAGQRLEGAARAELHDQPAALWNTAHDSQHVWVVQRAPAHTHRSPPAGGPSRAPPLETGSSMALAAAPRMEVACCRVCRCLYVGGDDGASGWGAHMMVASRSMRFLMSVGTAACVGHAPGREGRAGGSHCMRVPLHNHGESACIILLMSQQNNGSDDACRLHVMPVAADDTCAR